MCTYGSEGVALPVIQVHIRVMVDSGSFSQDEFPFEWVKTRDGSWTLRPLHPGAEWMHSLAGAYAESQYIYGEALRYSLKEFVKNPNHSNQTFEILSVGLGLAYGEWIASLECLKAGVKYKIHSFESEPKLKMKFTSEFQKSNPFSYLQDVFDADYPEPLWQQALLDLNPNLDSRSSVLYLHGALSAQTFDQVELKADIIFYDAYSAKTQSELWHPDFLNSFLKKYSKYPQCTFSTYACTSSLKKILLDEGFKITKKKGFANKRESTLAFRNM